MVEAQMRANIQSLMARLIQTQRALVDTVASRSCAEGNSTTRGHERLSKLLHSLVNTRTGQNGHSNSWHAWVLRIPN